MMLSKPSDIFFEGFLVSLQKLKFLNDDILSGHIEKISNRIETLDNHDDVMAVRRLVDGVYQALSSPSYYITRSYEVKGYEEVIEEVLLKLDNIIYSLKEYDKVLDELNKETIIQRLDQGTTKLIDGFDECYSGEPGTRLPNRASRFE